MHSSVVNAKDHTVSESLSTGHSTLGDKKDKKKKEVCVWCFTYVINKEACAIEGYAHQRVKYGTGTHNFEHKLLIIFSSYESYFPF